MSEGWKRLPVQGGGLQTVNARFMHRRRRLVVVYFLVLLAPLGVHRLYLNKPLGILGYWSLTAAFFWSLWQENNAVAWLAAGLLLAAVAFDLWRAPLWLNEYNKKLRQALFLRQDAAAAPPKNYQGRYSDAVLDDYLSAKSQERAGHGGKEGKARQTPLSFAEQERLLKQQIKENSAKKNQKES
jgi:TM2 domain-containing membrane protein YozV